MNIEKALKKKAWFFERKGSQVLIYDKIN
jgi:hypothetical protein